MMVSLVTDGLIEPDGGRVRSHEIVVRMLARADRVPSIRAMAADMAMRVDFDLDTIDDLRVAVEEACATVLANTDANSVLVCRILISASYVEISASVPLPEGRNPGVEPFSLRVLRVLFESVDCWTTHAGGQGFFHVELTRSMG
jgi:serine/threonine-protein kinase RsbW